MSDSVRSDTAPGTGSASRKVHGRLRAGAPSLECRRTRCPKG
ncbi:hypothetical protein [Streptomyces sp. SA15]|nr:hypothetical protein [Streptomyces sp. SA15]